MSSQQAPASPRQPLRTGVESFDGTPVCYDLYDAASASTVLVVPGFWRDRRYLSMVKLAAFLNDLGYRVAIMDCRGHGESGGVFGFNLHEHHDVAAVVRDLVARTPTAGPITLLGFSYGGAIAISTIARHELPVAAALLISPVADFSMIAPRINPFTIHRHIAFGQALRRPRFTWRMRRAAKLRAVDDIASVHVPVCLIHVRNDWLIGHRHSLALYEAAHEPKELHVLDIEGNYHADRILGIAGAVIEPIVTDFLRRYA